MTDNVHREKKTSANLLDVLKGNSAGFTHQSVFTGIGISTASVKRLLWLQMLGLKSEEV